MWLVKLNILATELLATRNEVVGGLVGDVINSAADGIKNTIANVAWWIVTSVFNILTPFFEWGCKSIIVMCIVIFYCTGDKKAISTGLKYFFIYIMFLMIERALR